MHFVMHTYIHSRMSTTHSRNRRPCQEHNQTTIHSGNTRWMSMKWNMESSSVDGERNAREGDMKKRLDEERKKEENNDVDKETSTFNRENETRSDEMFVASLTFLSFCGMEHEPSYCVWLSRPFSKIPISFRIFRRIQIWYFNCFAQN